MLRIPRLATGVEKDVVEMPAASIPASVSLNLASRAAASETDHSISVHNPRVRGGGLHIWNAVPLGMEKVIVTVISDLLFAASAAKRRCRTEV
jgi:hypothetical protein